jgi:disulfide bond formation protein DsbB
MNVGTAEHKGIRHLIRIVLLFALAGWLFGIAAHTEAAELEGAWWYQAPEEQQAHLSGELPVSMAWPGKWKSFDFSHGPALQDGQRTVWLMTMVSPVSPQSNILLFETTNQAVRVWLGKHG